MKVFLDDLRPTPQGYIRTYTVAQTIEILETRKVSDLSLDNDLGDNEPEGYKCVDWLEEAVYFDPTFPIPNITIHSSNASRVQYMQSVVKKLNAIKQSREQQT